MNASNPLDDKAAFEFGDGADDDDDGAAQRAAGVDLFAETEELDAQVIKFVECFQEVPNTPGQPVACPDQHDVETATTSIAHEFVEAGAAGAGATDAMIDVFLHDLQVPLSGQGTQIHDLRLRTLIEGRNSQVQSGAFHQHAPRAMTLSFQRGELVLDVAEMSRVRLWAAQFEGLLNAEQLLQAAGTADFLVDLVTGRTRTQGAAAAN